MSNNSRRNDHVFDLITVLTGEDRQAREQFCGAWVVEPHDGQRSADDGADAGMCFGVADTAPGNVAVYAYHVNDGRPAVLKGFADIESAEEWGLPSDIANQYRLRSGRVVFRDF